MVSGPIRSGAAKYAQCEGLHARRRNPEISMYGYTFPAECPVPVGISHLFNDNKCMSLVLFALSSFLLLVALHTVKKFISIAVTVLESRSREPL
jgi:hypothetical protein